MAHAQDLTLADVKQVQLVLHRLRSTKPTYFAPKQGFQLADAMLDFLGEVKRQLLERSPALEAYPQKAVPGMGLYFGSRHTLEADYFHFAWLSVANT